MIVSSDSSHGLGTVVIHCHKGDSPTYTYRFQKLFSVPRIGHIHLLEKVMDANENSNVSFPCYTVDGGSIRWTWRLFIDRWAQCFFAR